MGAWESHSQRVPMWFPARGCRVELPKPCRVCGAPPCAGCCGLGPRCSCFSLTLHSSLPEWGTYTCHCILGACGLLSDFSHRGSHLNLVGITGEILPLDVWRLLGDELDESCTVKETRAFGYRKRNVGGGIFKCSHSCACSEVLVSSLVLLRIDGKF